LLYQQYTAGEGKIGKGQREVPNIEIDFTIRNGVLLNVKPEVAASRENQW
jgi:hypothetical protein